MIISKCDNCKFQINVEIDGKHDMICAQNHWRGQGAFNTYGKDIYDNYWDDCEDFESGGK